MGKCFLCTFYIYFLPGVFDVHKHGENPLTCGDINLNQGFQLLEAYNYALDYVNSKRGVFNGRLTGVTLGGLGLDACMSPTKVGNLVTNIHSGVLELQDPSGMRIPTERIEAYIGGYGSDVSQRLAEVFTVLGIPQVSYGSSAMSLIDDSTYPYFSRTVPSDLLRAQAMVALLKRQRVEYIQVVVSDDINLMESARTFIQLASDKGICVSQNITVDYKSAASLRDAVSALLWRRRASVVITFLEYEAVQPFLDMADQMGTSDLRFFGSETWADRRDTIASLGSVPRGAITLGVEKGDNSAFLQYLERKTPSTYTSNPWFNEYYEQVYHCSLIPGTGPYPSQCGQTSRGVTQATGFMSDPYVMYVVDAVFAAALGIDRTLRRLCGDTYSGVCEAYRRSGDRRQRVLEGIKTASFPDTSDKQV